MKLFLTLNLGFYDGVSEISQDEEELLAELECFSLDSLKGHLGTNGVKKGAVLIKISSNVS